MEVIDLHDMRVMEAAGQAAFIAEEFHLGRDGGQLRVQQFEGDVQTEGPVPGLPDFTHTTLPQGVGQLEALDQHLAAAGLP